MDLAVEVVSSVICTSSQQKTSPQPAPRPSVFPRYSMQATKVSVICSVIATLLPTTAASNTIRNLEDESDSATAGGISTVSIACVAAAAAVVIALLVVVKVRATGNVNARKEVEMHEVVISPSQPIGLQPMSTKKQFVYTAHI